MYIDYRLATRSDFDAVRDLIPLSVSALSEGVYTPRQIESALTHIFGVDTQLIEDGTYLVAEIGGQIVGCGGWSKRKTLYGGDQSKQDEDTLLDPKADAARIRAFYVHPDWARRGIGTTLIRACEDAAMAQGFTRAELVATLPGEGLYAAMGYSVLERVELALPDGEVLPCARMGKTLS
jgi:GNAT superfamily N-acetyltransferase